MKTSTQPKTKPSELAMKAAADISANWLASDNWIIDAEAAALIIDRETNLPTLLKQRDALKEACEAAVEFTFSDFSLETRRQMFKKLKSALALCDKE